METSKDVYKFPKLHYRKLDNFLSKRGVYVLLICNKVVKFNAFGLVGASGCMKAKPINFITSYAAYAAPVEATSEEDRWFPLAHTTVVVVVVATVC